MGWYLRGDGQSSHLASADSFHFAGNADLHVGAVFQIELDKWQQMTTRAQEQAVWLKAYLVENLQHTPDLVVSADVSIHSEHGLREVRR